jgi:serine/threonine protein kinase
MIHVTCQNCSITIQVPATVAGRQGLCFGCGSPIVVPNKTADALIQSITFETGAIVNDRYVIGSSIGKGGMGEVYKAHDRLIDEEVALKFMNPRALRTQMGQQRFIKEAQIARRLRHENIVSVHDVATTREGVLYLSMELLKGTSLRDYMRKHRNHKKHLDVRLAIRIILQILSGLEYAHKMVVHRDLKPENVMLLPGEKIKVLDFGLAVAVEGEEDPHQAAPGAKKRVIGTAVYASPEQHRHQTIDQRSDLYTVGLLLKEVLTLRTPVDEQVEVMRVRKDVAPSIIQIVNRSVMTQKERRYQSAAEFKLDLETAYNESYRKVTISEVVNDSGKTVDTKNMTLIEGGSFMMGTNDIPAESPAHEAFVEPFYIDKYPVTFEEYIKFVEETDFQKPKFWDDPELNGPRQPVSGITFSEALAYATWAGKQLPSEKQWECAARGKEDRKYPWGTLEPDTTLCNYGDYLGMPSIVTMHDSGQTPEGVFDMVGNVFEWTIDHYLPYSRTESKNTSDEPRRVVRGGSWHSDPNELTTTCRKGLFPETQLTTVGFRCVIAANRVGT